MKIKQNICLLKFSSSRQDQLNIELYWGELFSNWKRKKEDGNECFDNIADASNCLKSDLLFSVEEEA